MYKIYLIMLLAFGIHCYAQNDSVSSHRFQVKFGFGGGSIVSGEQADHGIFFTAENGDQIDSSTSFMAFGLYTDYLINHRFALCANYDAFFIKATPSEPSNGKSDIDLFFKQKFSVGPRINLYTKALNTGSANLYSGLLASYNRLTLQDEYKDLITASGETPFDDAATGFGWAIHVGGEFFSQIGLVMAAELGYEYDEVDFDEAILSKDASSIHFKILAGYQFRN